MSINIVGVFNYLGGGSTDDGFGRVLEAWLVLLLGCLIHSVAKWEIFALLDGA